MMMKRRAERNRTLTCTEVEMASLGTSLVHLGSPVTRDEVVNCIINQDLESALPFLPDAFVDLMVIDPPYNLTKDYNGNVFRAREPNEYAMWFDNILSSLLPLLRPHASLYVCSDWQTSSLVFPVLDKYLHVRNRITWERDKGRGAKANWKNNSEDIWFCTIDNHYSFNVDMVKLRKQVIAPYRTLNGSPKDWEESQTGNFRMTYPSNFWSDITVPFWSMPENTDHPTQKPEKLFAKLVLASSNPGDFVMDPFLGSGTSAVVAQKLGRRFCGIEVNREYCCWAVKRLNNIEKAPFIQGYANGVFWERNSLNDQKSVGKPADPTNVNLRLFND